MNMIKSEKTDEHTSISAKQQKKLEGKISSPENLKSGSRD